MDLVLTGMEYLPTEILIEILKALPGLHDLHSIRCASPAAAALLQTDAFAAEIVSAIISTNLRTSTQAIIHIIARLLWGPDPSNINLESYELLCQALDGAGIPESGRGPPNDEPWRYPQLKTPAAPILRLLSLAKPARRLGHMCFHTLLSGVLAAPRRRPVDPSIRCF